jgi:signal transduction histidine kinase
MNAIRTIYLGAWAAYMLTSLALFPYLRITVLSFTIPLAMTAAWFYHCKGAFLTILLTIPYNLLMMYSYSADAAIIFEAVNPVGLALVSSFACWTARIKNNRERYQELNASLEQTVEEQTLNLRLLTDRLLDITEIEHANVTKTLLDQPLKELRAMTKTSDLLEKQLEVIQHPGIDNAQAITKQIHNCLNHLQSLGASPSLATQHDFDFGRSLNALISRMHEVSGTDIYVIHEYDWAALPKHAAPHLYQIIHEALSNALRHAAPSRIEVGFVNKPEQCMIYVENDGKPMADPDTTGMGISLMRYRAARIKGSLSILCGPGKNTRIQCLFPCLLES